MDILLHEVRETPRPKAKGPWCGIKTRQPWLDLLRAGHSLELVAPAVVCDTECVKNRDSGERAGCAPGRCMSRRAVGGEIVE